MYFLLERWIFIAMLVYWRVNVTDSCRYFPDSFNCRRNRCLEPSHIDPSTPFPDALVDIVDERVRNSLVPSWGFVFWAESWLPWKDQISRQVEHLCLWKTRSLVYQYHYYCDCIYIYIWISSQEEVQLLPNEAWWTQCWKVKKKKTFARFYTFL